GRELPAVLLGFLLARETLSFYARIEANGIDDDAGLVKIPSGTFKGRAVAVPVHAVSEDDDRPALLNWSQSIQRHLHRVVDSGVFSGVCLPGCAAQNCLVAGKVVPIV